MVEPCPASPSPPHPHILGGGRHAPFKTLLPVTAQTRAEGTPLQGRDRKYIIFPKTSSVKHVIVPVLFLCQLGLRSRFSIEA